jgi:kynurenine 3-monooxygenase
MSEKVIVLGAGLVGSLMACYLRDRGYEVEIYEKRRDMRKITVDGGRSINLALSDRGWKALYEVGVGEKVKKFGIPMSGRLMHDMHGDLSQQPYGENGESIYSVSRSKLNEILIEAAEEKGANIYFEVECDEVSFEKTFIRIKGTEDEIGADLIIGADGAFSAMRRSFQRLSDFNERITTLDHGYKELTIPPKNQDFAMDPNFLHIWPRDRFMLIALPNQDKSFTCTLFFPLEGDLSFESIKDENAISEFFNQYFPDSVPLMPGLTEEYQANPTSKLLTIQCYPWSVNRCLMIGDASHAIVPFYGQGMNSGFEDCRIFNEMIQNSSIIQILDQFQSESNH